MRILQLAPPWFQVPPPWYGGTERIVSLLADGLTESGHEVTLLASGDSDTSARLERVYRQPQSTKLGDAVVEAAHTLHGYLMRNSYDIVHDHTGVVGPALGAVIDGPPVIHTLHRAWTPDRIRLFQQIAPFVQLVAVSHDQALRTPADIRIAAVVHNAVPIDEYPLVEEKQDYLAFVGRASPEKGPTIAAEVARRLGKPLVMAIKINQEEEVRYWEEVVKPSLEGVDAEVLTGPDDIAHVLGHAAVVLFPIQWPEPFGLVPAEANSCGTPVVAFSVGAIPEVIADGRSGILVAPGEIDAFCEAVEEARILDPVECRRHVVEHFSPARLVADYARLYKEVTVGE